MNEQIPYSPLKRIERSVRRWFNKSYKSKAEPTLVTQPDDVLGLRPSASILFLRQDRIGDVLLFAPIIKAVRDKYPNATIDVVLSINNIAAERCVAPFTNKRYVYKRTLISLLELVAKIRREKYDVIVDLIDNTSSTSSILVSRSKIEQSVGIDKENSGVYSVVVPLLDRKTTHISRRVAQLLLPFGIDPASVVLDPVYEISDEEVHRSRSRLGISADSDAFRLGINVSASSELRGYSAEKTTEVVEYIRKKYPTVELTLFASPLHLEKVEAILSTVAAGSVVKAAPLVKSFHEFACMLHEMNALWTPDTSAVHLAAAWKMPQCVMYNQPNPDIMPWYPHNSHYEAVINHGENLNNIEPKRIMEALDRLFAYCGITAE